MVTRWIAVALGLLVTVGGLATLKGAEISVAMAAGKRAARAGPPPETVNTAVARAETWEVTLSSVGSVAAVRGVSIGNDAAGLVSRIHFESGENVRAGQVLVELDAGVERAQLAAARARARLAAINLGRTTRLVESRSISADQLDADRSAMDQASADVRALEAQIQKKIVRAPFAGRLGIRLVNVGQYLSSGTAITVLEAPVATYVDFSLPQQDLARLKPGMPVRFESDSHASDAGAPHEATGALFAVDPEIDPTTRNIKLRASAPAAAGWLSPGMFVRVSVIEPERVKVVAIPATAVLHASYGDSVFVVENDVARQRFVRAGRVRGDFVAIDEGIRGGEVVVTGGAFKLRNGARVVPSNAVGPTPSLHPNPPNR
jgi:membrane fusion protein (multidrug efflux system)